MIKLLLKNRFAYLMSTMFGRSRKGKKPSMGTKILFGALGVYLVAVFVALFGAMALLLVPAFIEADMEWMAFALPSVMAFLLAFMGSIFTAQTQIFEARDNELMLSMPIKPSAILASRLLMLLLMNYLYVGVVLIPAGVVYCVFGTVTVAKVIIFVAALLILPFLVLALSCVFGWLIALITSKLKRKNLFTVVLMIVFFGAYMYACMNLQKYLELLVLHGEQIAVAIQKALPPFYSFGVAVASGSWLNLLWFALWCLVPFAIVYYILSKSFIKIATTKRGGVRYEYHKREMQMAAPRKALFLKEFSRFTSMPMYIFNCAIGSVMMLIFGAFLLIKGGDMGFLLSTFPPQIVEALSRSMPLLVCAALGFCATMNSTTSPSISLEGKGLWILRSAPIKPMDVFMAKIGVNMVVGAPPAIFAGLIAIFIFKFNIIESVCVLVLPTLIQFFIAAFGIFVNLRMPRFDFPSETTVIKQSGSVMIGMFGGMAFMAVPVIGYILLKNLVSTDAFMLICIAFFGLLSGLMLLDFKTKGTKIFNNL